MADDVLDFDPMRSPHREDPHLFYREARARPIAVSPSIGAFMITRYEDIAEVLDDPGRFSSAAAVPDLRDNPPEVVAELDAAGVVETTVVVNEVDSAAHTHQRRLYDLSFSGARVRALLPTMRQRATALLDALPAGEADLVSGYSSPFVRTVIETVIGIPAHDSGQVQAWTGLNMMLLNPLLPLEERVEAARHMGDYHGYLQHLIAQRRTERRDDLISDLVHGTDELPGLTDIQVINIVRAARVAGFDTTRDAISAVLLAILQHPDVRRRVLADPAGALPKVTEEVLRRDAPHRGLFRVATRATEIDGTPIPAGAPLLLMFGSGNRDEAMFPEPDQLNPDRPGVRAHLAFGQGLHRCPAPPLARAEIRVAVETLLARRPSLQLAPGYEPVYSASYWFRGLERLHVA